MKHIFYIHSFITYLVSKEVIKYYQLPVASCIFLYGRDFKPATPLAGLVEEEIPYSHHPVKSFTVKRLFWQSWAELWAFDRYVKKLTRGQPFLLYTNQTGIDFICLFLTHKHCHGFSFLEEGVFSYHKQAVVNHILCPAGYATLIYKTLLLMNYGGRLTWNKFFYSPGYTHVYGISPDAFPDFARKVLLTCPFTNSEEKGDYQNILVLDGAEAYGLVSNESMIAALRDALHKLVQKGVQHLSVKYHPEQLKNRVALTKYQALFQEFATKIAIQELPQEVCLELIAGNQQIKKVEFYVFLSSVGLYAGLCGRKAFSFAKLVVKYEPTYDNRLQLLPAIYKNLVEFIA